MDNKESPDDILIASEAAAYLSEKWQIPFSVGAFRQYRLRLRRKGKGMESSQPRFPNSSAWKRRELDALEPPDATMRRGTYADDKPAIDNHGVTMLSYA